MGFLRLILRYQILERNISLITDMATNIVNSGMKIDLFYEDCASILHQYDFAKLPRRLLS